MKKNRISLLFPLLFTLLWSCSDYKSANVNLKVNGVADSTNVVVSKLSLNKIDIIDTLYTKAETVSYKINIPEGTSEFVYFTVDGTRPLSLILLPGDDVRVILDRKTGSVEIANSPESEKMLLVDRSIAVFNSRFDSLLKVMDAVAGNAVKEKGLKRELGSLYIKQKQESVKYIYNNPGSISVLPLLYQKTTTGLPLFSEVTDGLLMERVYDSLKNSYPKSQYLIALADEVYSRRNMLDLMNKSELVEEVDFPEIVLPDIKGEARSLTALKGNVIALVFWTVGNEQQRQFNIVLKDLYDRYHGRGLEIYQVSMDTDKTAWAMQVKAQELPWASVCEPAYGASNAAMLYNVQELPALYLIDRNGTIIAKNVFDSNQLEKIIGVSL